MCASFYANFLPLIRTVIRERRAFLFGGGKQTMARRRRRRSGFCDADDGVSWFVLSTVLALSVAVVSGDGQEDGGGGQGPGGGKYISRAPRSCPHRPSHCTSLQRAPWTCRPESDCMRNNFNQSVSKFVKSAPSVNLAASTYYFDTGDDRCHHALNLTWTMNPKDTIGFFLRIVRSTPSRNISNQSRGLTFWIDERRLTPERERENGMVTFYSDCYRLGVASKYDFELFSLHAVPDSSKTASKFIGNVSLATDCDTYPEADPVFRLWDAWTHIDVSPLDSSVKVFFAPAAQSLGFYGYDLTVSELSTPAAVLAGVYNLTFTCTNFDVIVIRDICPGSYRVKVTANGGYCPCANCSDCARSTPFDVPRLYSGDCRNDNISAVVGLPSLVTGELPDPAPMPVQEEATSQAVKSPINNNTIVNGILITAFCAVIAIAIITVAANTKRRKTQKTVVEGTGPEKKPTLLMIYARDNALHCDAVRCLAAYLEQRCRCRVQLDETGGGQLSSAPLDWLLVQMESADGFIVVNSEAGWRQFEGDSRGVVYRKVAAGGDAAAALDDVFLPAVKKLQRTRYYTHQPLPTAQGNHRRLFKVAFPYTDRKFFIDDVHPWARTYHLMDDIDQLCLDFDRRPSQPSGAAETNGSTAAVGIDGPVCAEGRQLQVAVDRAGEYFRSNADWFSSFYRQETSASEQTTIITTATCFDATHWPSASPEVLDSGLGSSAENIYLGTNFVPPNVSGSFDDDDDEEDTDSILRASLAETIGQINIEFDKAFSRLD